MNRSERRKFKATDRVKFKCTCGADASIAVTSTSKDAILHMDPPCEPYLRDRDPNDYLEECRKAMEAKARS